MYKCVKAFMSTTQEKWYYGMHATTFQHKNFTEKEQKNFVLEVEPVKPFDPNDPLYINPNPYTDYFLSFPSSPDTDVDTNEFQGYDNGSSGGGGASGEY